MKKIDWLAQKCKHFMEDITGNKIDMRGIKTCQDEYQQQLLWKVSQQQQPLGEFFRAIEAKIKYQIKLNIKLNMRN